jgi:hypothetical protein
MAVTVSRAQPVGVRGPAWADASHKGGTVLNPLRVQSHVRRTVGAYVPGVTAVTAHARYYGLHPWLAAVANEQGLDHGAFLDLVAGSVRRDRRRAVETGRYSAVT